MWRPLIGFMICFLLWNCAKKEDQAIEHNFTYIISYENKKLQKHSDSLKNSNSNLIVIPPRRIYGESQLIIDKKGNFYFYQRDNIVKMCGTRSPYDTLPHLIGLKPNDIVRIPQKSLNDFLSENILTKEKDRRILTIASQCDTIKNSSLFNFINKNNIDTYLIRRTTQEEDTVLKYKKNNKFYYSEDIKWDENKIQLPFTKPKLNH
ncbi:hypothetical protein [Flavobacterium sp. ASV13]|uniref:hypothetical protein n=1 Tax=Flavobacterium sp. ASV13 TaxID=1506583 RepID=UPI000551B791|nr:hypothetical protein [Flavobacterium sp. ASV13]